MIVQTDRKPMATAWVGNQYYVVYDIREIRRGFHKGRSECFVRKGSSFNKVIIKPGHIIRYLENGESKS